MTVKGEKGRTKKGKASKEKKGKLEKGKRERKENKQAKKTSNRQPQARKRKREKERKRGTAKKSACGDIIFLALIISGDILHEKRRIIGKFYPCPFHLTHTRKIPDTTSHHQPPSYLLFDLKNLGSYNREFFKW